LPMGARICGGSVPLIGFNDGNEDRLSRFVGI
jgi:hypothetical protein